MASSIAWIAIDYAVNHAANEVGYLAELVLLCEFGARLAFRRQYGTGRIATGSSASWITKFNHEKNGTFYRGDRGMRSGQWNEATLSKLQDLIEANFTGRDELYAAANSLCDADRQQVCCRLAEHLADHAIELQQIVAANGGEPVEPSQFPAVAEALFERAKSKRGAMT